MSAFLLWTVLHAPDGLAFAPYYENPAEGMLFDRMIDEAADTGAGHLSVVVSWAQRDIYASRIGPHPKETQDDAVVRRIIRRARGRGMKVVLFPILWVEERAPGRWRGTLRPDNEAAWWADYERFVLHYARMAAEERVQVFSVGSELASMEGELERWAVLIGRVRAIFSGRLIYSANWDHYRPVRFWHLVDYVGMTAYHRLTERTRPDLEELVAAWTRVRETLRPWLAEVGKTSRLH